MAIQLSVSTNNITITKIGTINQGEYGVNECEFTFTEEYNNLIKRAVFTDVLGKNYLVPIENNACEIPIEVLILTGDIKIGVYAYEVDENDDLILRYSPKYVKFSVTEGSYIRNVTLPNKTMQDVFTEITSIKNQISDMQNQITIMDGQISSINANLAIINETLNELNRKSIIVKE